MVTTPIKKTVLLLFVAGLITAPNASADRIVLKDGTTEESERVWVSEAYVHFILKGTSAVEIRYAKEIVEHIEGADGTIRDLGTKGPPQAVPQSDPASPTATPIAASDRNNISSAPGAFAAPSVATESKPIRVDRAFIDRNRHLTFYDPRRPQRYWADRQSQHSSYEGAMAVLAAQYAHSVEWIENHMGQENDLGDIHARLIAALEAEATPLQSRPDSEQGSTAPVKDQPAPADTIQAPPVAVAATSKDDKGSPSSIQAVPSGIPFYDPRRPEKYWASPKEHCASLKEAIEILATIYHVPVAHIEKNMGESNDLSQIHATIQKSLEKSQE